MRVAQKKGKTSRLDKENLSRTLILSSITGEAEIDDNRFSNGDRIFGDLEKDYLDFYKETWGLLNGNLKDYII